MKRLVLFLMLAAASACHRDRNPPALRLGFFPNLTHAQALVGANEGTFRSELHGVPLEVKQFNAGPAAMEGILAGSIDVCYVGSGPALIAYARSNGAVRVIAGAASGGSMLVVHSATSAAQLSGKRVGSPQIGNSQDVALRHWLHTQGLESTARGGTVTIVPQPNAEILALFREKQIEGAWVPEPWASRLVSEADGHVLIDEHSLWPGGRFPTTVLLATTDALTHRRERVKAVVRAHVRLTRQAHLDAAEFARRTNTALAHFASRGLPMPLVDEAFRHLELVLDPMPTQLQEVAKHAAELGYVPAIDVSGLVDRSLLDEVLREEPGQG